MASDRILWHQFTHLLSIAAQLGQPQQAPTNSLERAAIANNKTAADGFARILTTLAVNPKALSALAEHTETKLAPLVQGFDAETYYQALETTSNKMREAVARAVDQQALAVADKNGELIAKGPEKPKVPPKPANETGTREKGSSTEDGGDDPSDTPPPNVYGEELDSLINGEYAISIHVIKCDDVTGWGPSGQLDDEIAWYARSRQKFTGLTEIQAEFTSSEYEDVSNGDRYSALDDTRHPNESETKVELYKDDRLCPRIWRPFIVRGKLTLREDNESAFKLDKFEYCSIRIMLFEVGETLEGIIEEILRLILHLTGLGVGAGTALSPAGLLQSALGSHAQNSLVQNSIQQLEKFISDLLGSDEDKIGTARFSKIKKSDIETAFNSGTPVAAPNEGFNYVLGQERTLTGKNSTYKIQLRYEKH